MSGVETVSRSSGTTKSKSAFRTISEVSDELQIPQHVLRFWETKFKEVQPLKRGGGRRYYRPEDITLLRRIRDLLYTEGYTIKGVQKLLRDGQIMQPVPGEMPVTGAEVGQGESGESSGTQGAMTGGDDSLGAGRKASLEAILDELLAIRERLRDLR